MLPNFLGQIMWKKPGFVPEVHPSELQLILAPDGAREGFGASARADSERCFFGASYACRNGFVLAVVYEIYEIWIDMRF